MPCPNPKSVNRSFQSNIVAWSSPNLKLQVDLKNILIVGFYHGLIEKKAALRQGNTFLLVSSLPFQNDHQVISQEIIRCLF